MIHLFSDGYFHKKCYICSSYPLIADFWKSSSAEDGYQSHCKSCSSKRVHQITISKRKTPKQLIKSKIKQGNQIHKAATKRKKNIRQDKSITAYTMDGYVFNKDRRQEYLEDQNYQCFLCKLPSQQRLIADAVPINNTHIVFKLLCHACYRQVNYITNNQSILTNWIEYLNLIKVK